MRRRRRVPALELLDATLPALRHGLTERAARTVAYELFEKLGFGAVAVTDTRRVLAFVGAGADHHAAGERHQQLDAQDLDAGAAHGVEAADGADRFGGTQDALGRALAHRAAVRADHADRHGLEGGGARLAVHGVADLVGVGGHGRPRDERRAVALDGHLDVSRRRRETSR